MKKKVTVIGMGYVGFPLACAIARSEKYEVIGFDYKKEKVDLINKRISPVEDEQAAEDIRTVDIKATTDEKEIEGSDFIVVCVPTPVDEKKIPDFSHLKDSARVISKYLKKDQIIIFESTVNPGVSDEILLPILEETGLKGGVDFDLIHSPERIDPGSSQWNVYNIPRNVGGTSPEGTRRAADFYRSFLPIQINEMSSLKAAEATKIIENTFRDINIAYVNELAKSFDMMGLDIVEVIKGASSKPFAFLPHYPGCGVGGHCISVDPYYLIERAREAGFDHKFLVMAREINNSMPAYTINKLLLGMNEIRMTVKGSKIGLLGLSYKPNVGDLRESPALEIVEEIEKLGGIVLRCDPHVEGTVPLAQVLKEADAIVLATAHKEFLQIKDWNGVKVIVDGRNILDKEEIESKGIVYRGIGRGI